jgi:hypothetical protein
MGRLKESVIPREERGQRAASLEDLMQAGIGVFCWCNRCGHNAEVTTEMLVPQLWPSHGPITRHN